MAVCWEAEATSVVVNKLFQKPMQEKLVIVLSNLRQTYIAVYRLLAHFIAEFLVWFLAGLFWDIFFHITDILLRLLAVSTLN